MIRDTNIPDKTNDSDDHIKQKEMSLFSSIYSK